MVLMNGPGAPRRVRMSGKRALFEQLVADGVTAVFGNPGTTEQGFLDTLQDYPSLTYYLALHEGVAVGMADAYARASRRAAFVQLHIAPGLGNALGMLYNARVGHSPMVVYAGQSPTTGLFQEPYLSGDLVSMARPVTKWAAEITQPSDVPQALRRAFKVAQEPPQGPVLLSLPMDVLESEADMAVATTAHVDWRTRPSREWVDTAAAMLAGARFPAIAVGDHVAVSGAQDEVVALAELLGAPILNAFSNGVNAPAGHPLYQPRGIPVTSGALREILEPYDVLLATGTSLFPSILPDSSGPIPESTKVIHVDYDSWELGKNHPSSAMVRADPGESLRALLKALRRRSDAGSRAAWQARRAELEQETMARREKMLAAHRTRWNSTPISPHRLMAEVAAALPEDASVFDESITSGGSLEMYLKPSHPWRRFRARGGGIGPGMPGTLGLKVAMPERPVVGIVSDGASMFNITALWTAAHHRMPVTYIVCNNGSYRILKQNLRDYRTAADIARPFPHMDLTDPDLRFDRIAEAFGVPARRIEHPDEIGDAIRQAMGSHGPVLLDVVLDGDV